MKKIFLCTPYAGDVKANVKNACSIARQISAAGHAVFAPHLIYPHFLDDDNTDERWAGMKMGQAFLKVCNELWYWSPGEMSDGMKAEIQVCLDFRISVIPLAKVYLSSIEANKKKD